MRRNYEQLYKAFDSDKIDVRFKYLSEKANDFMEKRDIEKYIIINNKILKELIIDYFADFKRIKEFLQVENTQAKEVSSYLVYWIIRKKPLELKNKSDYQSIKKKPFLKYINEWFAFHIILNNTFFLEEYNLFYDL